MSRSPLHPAVVLAMMAAGASRIFGRRDTSGLRARKLRSATRRGRRFKAKPPGTARVRVFGAVRRARR